MLTNILWTRAWRYPMFCRSFILIQIPVCKAYFISARIMDNVDLTLSVQLCETFECEVCEATLFRWYTPHSGLSVASHLPSIFANNSGWVTDIKAVSCHVCARSGLLRKRHNTTRDTCTTRVFFQNLLLIIPFFGQRSDTSATARICRHIGRSRFVDTLSF